EMKRDISSLKADVRSDILALKNAILKPDSLSSRDLPNGAGTGGFPHIDAMTIAKCNNVCRSQGFKYAGSQFGEQCFCGNDFGSQGKVADSECNVKCQGNSEEVCGGGFRNSIHLVRYF
ncbi:unnamed protein product, partial [Owenia fusiformis]